MSSFDAVAREWDKDKMHLERSEAIAKEMSRLIPVHHSMKALEYGAGTGILSFLLKDKFEEITLMDSSREMIKVCEEKAAFYEATHIKPRWIDLEHTDFDGKFDLIFNQMVMHHVNDANAMLKRFFSMLNPGGYLAIADLFTEDGSFHGPDASVHHGFDPSVMSQTLLSIGFKSADHTTCFVVKRADGREYPVFLLVASK